MQNVEIKARLRNREQMESRVEAIRATIAGKFRQRDTFFRTARDAWLKLREVEPGGAELIAYRRTSDTAAPRFSEYERAAIIDVSLWHALLSLALGVETVVTKERTLWLLDLTRIHFDEVEGLGSFIELETAADRYSPEEAQAENRRIIELLGLRNEDFIALPYRDLLGDTPHS